MRNLFNFLTIILIFSFHTYCTAQNLTVEYSTYIRQTLDEKTKKQYGNDEIGKAQIKANEEPPEENYKLIISNKESSFTYLDRINNSQNQTFDIRFAPGGFGTTYHNLSDSSLLKEIGEIYGNKYIITDSLPIFNWKIVNETKEILGLKVRKASTFDGYGNSIIAWYAPTIPLSHGPAEFWGLPGLILEVERSSNTKDFKAYFIAKSIDFPKKKPKVIKPTKGIQIKESDLKMIYEEGRKKQQEMNAQGVKKN